MGGVVLLWIVAAGVLLALTVPYVEEERIPNYLFILLRSQEFLVLLFVTVLACLSLPRERERRTIITTGSKPLSRLELFLGKVTGFMGVGLVTLAVMGVLSWGFLLAVDARIRSTAKYQYDLALQDYARESSAVAGKPEAATQPGKASTGESIESKRQLAEQGALFAYNYITVGKSGMQVAGWIDMEQTPPERWLRGGGQGKLIYHFPARDPATGATWLRPVPGAQPRLLFKFGVVPWGRPLPREFDLHVTAVPLPSRLRQQEKTVTMRMVPGGAGSQRAEYWATWPMERPEEVLGGVDAEGNVNVNDVDIEITCPQVGVYLIAKDPTPASPVPNVWILTDPERSMGAPCNDPPRMLGFEKRDKQQFQGQSSAEAVWIDGRVVSKTGVAPMPPETAVWRFTKVQRADVPVRRDKDGKDVFTLAMELDVEKTASQNVPALLGMSVVGAMGADGKPQVWQTQTTVVEKRVMRVDVPAALLSREGNDLTVYMSALVPGHWIAAVDNSVRVEQRSSFFLVNLLKSEAIIFGELALLVTVAVTCSIRLGFPVAMLSTITVYILGFCLTFIKTLQESSGLSQLGFNAGTTPGSFYRLTDGILAVMFKLLYVLANLLPDFSRYDPTVYILDSRNIPWVLLAAHGMWLVVWALPFVAVGYLMIRKQELG